MKILYITPWRPSLTNGGGLHCYANLRSICNYPDVKIDYIGPSFDYDLPGIYRNKFLNIISRDYSVKDKMIAAINRVPTSLIALFKEFIRKYPIKKYDFIFVESTKCGFIFKYLKHSNKIICNIHNVESDYFKANTKGIKRLIYKYIFNSEKTTLNYCNVALIMHNFDRLRLKNLYSIKDTHLKFILHPVCSFPPNLPLVPFDKREKIILFIGSLDINFNEIGLRKFVNHCWPDLINFGYKLQVAGRNPSAKLVNFLSKRKNIEVFANPLNMETILRKARMIILPDLTGTGMKLRVAKALSIGVPVIGTKKGLKGYSNISDFGVEVNNISEMTYAIKKLVYNEDKLSALSFNAYKIWKEKYSFEVFCKRLQSILKKTLNNK